MGLPGSGKTTIGRQLARRLGQPFVDSDHVIEHQLGCSIREFFAREGEDSFRDVEQQVLDELTQTHEGVIATGGGAVLRETNRRHLHERGHVVYLRSTPEDVFRRVRHDTARPLLQVDDPLSRLRAFLGLFFESIDDRLGEGLGPAVPGSAESSPSPSRWMGGSVNIVAALGSRGAVSHRPLSPVATTLLAPSQSYRARTEWRESVHVTQTQDSIPQE